MRTGFRENGAAERRWGAAEWILTWNRGSVLRGGVAFILRFQHLLPTWLTTYIWTASLNTLIKWYCISKGKTRPLVRRCIKYEYDHLLLLTYLFTLIRVWKFAPNCFSWSTQRDFVVGNQLINVLLQQFRNLDRNRAWYTHARRVTLSRLFQDMHANCEFLTAYSVSTAVMSR